MCSERTGSVPELPPAEQVARDDHDVAAIASAIGSDEHGVAVGACDMGGEDGGQVVSGYQQMVTMGNMLQDETFDVVCRVSAWNGGTDMKKVRDRAFTLFASVEKAIRASNTLSSNVLFAYIQPVNYSQYQTEQGAVADLDFSITVRAAHF